jgi:hypothetical protein
MLFSLKRSDSQEQTGGYDEDKEEDERGIGCSGMHAGKTV